MTHVSVSAETLKQCVTFTIHMNAHVSANLKNASLVNILTRTHAVAVAISNVLLPMSWTQISVSVCVVRFVHQDTH